MTRIVDTPFGFFLNLDNVLAIHKPELVVEHHRSAIAAFVTFAIVGGAHAGRAEYRRDLWETGESRHPTAGKFGEDWHALELLVEVDGREEWRPHEALGEAKVVALARVEKQVAELLELIRAC